MTRNILFITQYKWGPERNIQRYGNAEMEECFTPQQRADLAAGKQIQFNARTEIVDLEAFYDANK